MIVEINKKSSINNNKLGNKGKFLTIMSNNGFQVPNGIILDSDCYDEFITYNKIDKKIEDLLDKLTSANIEKISLDIYELFDNSEFPDYMIDKINSLLKNKKYAVRSSGTKEDLDDYSFAGQYETFLNVEKYDVFKNIINCYKSMFSIVILSYLVNNSISFSGLKMSVVLQEMVDSDYSGICFTIDPTSGYDKELVIEIAKGLGENIVSGKVNPEQYHYNWYDDEVISTGKILTKKEVKEYGKIFSSIMRFFGYPCDIEFAIKDKKLYILQARKITKIKYNGIEDIWSTADFKDGGVSASVCTPYMWSLYEYIWEYTLKKFILDSKILTYKQVDKKLGRMFYGRPYWNLSVVKLAMSQVVGYKEREFDSEYGIKINYDGDGKTTKINIKSIVAIARMALAQSKILKERNNKAEYLKEDLLNKYNDYRNNYLNDNIKDIKSTWYKLIKEDYLYSESTYFWQIFINTIHQSLYKDSLLKYVSESEYLSLLSSIDNISHLLPFYDMWEVSRLINNDSISLEFWKNNKVDSIAKKINSKKYGMDGVRDIIEKYGYHSDKELDVSYPCYYEDITPIIISIKDMLGLDDKYSPLEDKKSGKKNYEEILKRIEKEVGKNKYKKIDTKVKNMRKMLWWREEFRDISTRFYYIIRIYTMLLSDELVKEKVLSNKEDIWYLKIEDIFNYLDKKITNKELNKIVDKNRLYYDSYRNYISENEIGHIFDGENNISFSSDIKGLGANSGIVTGTARVIKSFDEIDRLEKNDILVTKFTDTGWTPKFAILSGIVTEYGGILCHAAIVSREYGIPAIVCCHDAMKKIKDGDTITINGSTGIVKVEE